MNRIVSADEARKLLDYLDGERVCHCGTEARRHRYEEHGFVEMIDPEDTTTATVTDLAATVVRLYDILAAERGERAPDGWMWHVDANAHGYWMNPGVRAANGWPIVVRRLVAVGWSHDGRTFRDFALESIEAAVEAAKATANPSDG